MLSIQQAAKLAGTTSRALRHYDDIGLVPPSRFGTNGYRYYDDDALVRLQRVLLLRELGLGLPQIGELLDAEVPASSALRIHLELLRGEQRRLGRQIAAVEHTIDALTHGGDLMPSVMFDGFDHTQYRQEVEQRWGERAYADASAWWRDIGSEQRAVWKAEVERLNADWTAAAADDAVEPHCAVGQELAARHVAWLRSIPGTPAAGAEGDLDGYVRGLAQLYADDERFAANYGGLHGARFVRDALLSYLDAAR